MEALELASERSFVTAAEPFETLYLRHRTAVYRYARSRSATDDDAADLTALTFERAFVAYGRYRETGGGVLAWLFRIARNAAIDEARHRRLAVERESLVARMSAADPPDELARSETADEVRALLALLPEPAREAVVLRYASGLTAREIAEVMGKSLAATEKLLSRAIATLKEAHHVR